MLAPVEPHSNMEMESELAVWHEVRERFGGESPSSPNEVKTHGVWNDDGGHAQFSDAQL